MRRGRIFIYLALIIIIAVVAGWLYLRSRQKAAPQQPVGTQATPVVRFVQVISAGQNIPPGTLITEAMLSSYQMPEDNLVQGLFTNPQDVMNMYAKIAIPQGAPITASAISAIPGNVNLPGSSWATYIPQGLTAVSIPISRLSSAAFGIRDGDYVDVIVTMLLIDVDPALQSALPNKIASLESGQNGILKITQGDVTQGHFELDTVSNALMYIQPSENQRPRMVTQMIMQNIQVLHVGTFPLPGEATSDLLVAQSSGGPTATPQPANQPQTVPVVIRPDIITVMVTPQDAVMLTYLIYSGVEINLTLRNPNDQEPGAQPDAAMLEYLLTQYNIPVPAKLPYALAPRLDILQQPKLVNDATPVP
jgi:Flp pilus assembly protein CpaB